MSRKLNIAAIILAAGQSSRMGKTNKLLAELQGKPLIRHAVDSALASDATSVVVVTGHEANLIKDSLEGLPVSIVHNQAFAEGMSTSLKCGIRALANDVDGAVICLGDMPGIAVSHLNNLIAAFDPGAGRAICAPVYEGRRGNPVLWAQSFFEDMMDLTGDEGARKLLQKHTDDICEVEMSSDAVLRDVDTPEDIGG